MSISLFADKNQVTFFVPAHIADNKQDLFFVELIECIETYLHPLEYGFSKEDFIDYFQSKETDLLSFLLAKRYIIDDSEFLHLANKYSQDDFGHKVILNNCGTMSKVDLQKEIMNILNFLATTHPGQKPNWNIEAISFDVLGEV